ncbi:MAG: acetyl-CoA carboxylase biotin carboxyl carrier protein [Pseudomonadota bacterium]
MGHPKFDEDALRALATLLHESDLSEIEIEDGGQRIRVTRASQPVVASVAAATAPVEAPAAAPAAAAAPARAEGSVLSPMVGTAYRAPEPGAKPYVEVGDSVAAGAVVMIVEAMKTMNQIIAEKAGVVTAVFVEDGQPVEFNEPLLAIS